MNRILGLPNAAWGIASMLFGIASISWFHSGGGSEPMDHLTLLHPAAGIVGIAAAWIALKRKTLRPLAAVGLFISLLTPLLCLLLLYGLLNGGLVSH